MGTRSIRGSKSAGDGMDHSQDPDSPSLRGAARLIPFQVGSRDLTSHVSPPPHGLSVTMQRSSQPPTY